jgi:hypothetical protein
MFKFLMEIKLKRFTLSLIALMSSTAFAGTMGNVCNPSNVTVPCENKAFDISAHALYLKPVLNGNQYWFNYTGYNTNDGINTFSKNNNGWLWGFNIEGSYYYDTGADVKLNWYHLNGTNRHSAIAYTSLVSGSALNFDYNKVGNQWDAVNLEFGQHIDLSRLKNIRLQAGLQFANLNYYDIAPLSITTSEGAYSTSYNQYSTSFRGVGPRVGLDVSHDLIHSLNAYGSFASALVIGSSKNSDTSGAPPYFQGSTTTVLPELEGKLGLAYTHNMANGNLTVDGGYMAVYYFGAINLPANAIASSNYGFQGPYFGMKYFSNL